MLSCVQPEAPQVAQARWYLKNDGGLHLLLPGGLFLTVSRRCLELAGYDPEHPGRALKKLVDDGSAVPIPLPIERGGVGPMLRLSIEQATSLQREFSMPVARGFQPVPIPPERWGTA